MVETVTVEDAEEDGDALKLAVAALPEVLREAEVETVTVVECDRETVGAMLAEAVDETVFGDAETEADDDTVRDAWWIELECDGENEAVPVTVAMELEALPDVDAVTVPMLPETDMEADAVAMKFPSLG